MLVLEVPFFGPPCICNLLLSQLYLNHLASMTMDWAKAALISVSLALSQTSSYTGYKAGASRGVYVYSLCLPTEGWPG